MEDGHAVLRTRVDGSIELRINGVFVMDDQEAGSERRLARSALSQAHDPSTVVVGGLGLGFTVREVVAALAPASVDAILLDVDNGPDFLVYDDNAAVYQAPFVRMCATRLRPRGRLTIWSQADSEPLRTTLAESFAEVRSERVEVSLQQRAEAYWLLHATGPSGTTIMSSHER